MPKNDLRSHLLSRITKQRPDKPKSLMSYRDQLCLKIIEGWPCIECRGRCRIIDPCEVHKLSRRIDCPRCKGTGTGKRSDIVYLWNQHRKEQQERLVEWLETKTALKSALDKLSLRELEALDTIL